MSKLSEKLEKGGFKIKPSGYDTLKARLAEIAITSAISTVALFGGMTSEAKAEDAQARNFVKETMSNTQTEREIFAKMQKNSIKFTTLDNLIQTRGFAAQYDFDTKEMCFDKALLTRTIAGLATPFDEDLSTIPAHEGQHAIDHSKFDINSLNMTSTIELYIKSELNAHMTAGLVAFEEGGETWEKFIKIRMAETGGEISKKYSHAIGKELKNPELRKDLRKHLAHSFYSDKVSSSALPGIKMSWNDVYKLIYAASFSQIPESFGKTSVTENEIINKLELGDVSYITKRYDSLLTKDELNALIKTGLPSDRANKIPYTKNPRTQNSTLASAIMGTTR